MHHLNPLIAALSLIVSLGGIAFAQDNPGSRLPVEIVSWDGVSKRLQDSEVVVLGLVDSFAGANQEGKDPSPASIKLRKQLRKLRELGDTPIPGREEKMRYSSQIRVSIIESNQPGLHQANEAHQEKARSIYQMLDAPPYVMSNPTIFLIHRGQLVRCYGNYHEPGLDGIGLQQLVVALLSPDAAKDSLAPEILMMNALALRKEKGNEHAIEYLTAQLQKLVGSNRFGDAHSYFWTEAQVRSGSLNSVWASMLYDLLFTVCQRNDRFEEAMEVVSNLSSTLHACGRYGRLAEVMAVWEKGQKMAGNRMDISSYADLGPGIACLPEIRLRDMPITQPSATPIPAGSNSKGFHVNQAGAFATFAALQQSAGNWREALEYTVWIRHWATDEKSGQPIGEFAHTWYAQTSSLIYKLIYLGFDQQALTLLEEALAAPHGQTYHGRWKIFLAADHLHALSKLDQAPADLIVKFEELIAKARVNGHIGRSGVWSIQIKLAQALLKSGRIGEAEALFDQLIREDSSNARWARLKHWVESGRVEGVEEELKQLLNSSRSTGQKMNEYDLYKMYADFLEKSGRHQEALLIRREVIRLAKIFGLFTHLAVEQSKLAVLLLNLNDRAGADAEAQIARAQTQGNRLPPSIISKINANLAQLPSSPATKAASEPNPKNVDLQPRKSVVIPLADRPWTTYLTLTNPGSQIKEGRLTIRGQAIEYSLHKETDDIIINLVAAKQVTKPTDIRLSVKPGTHRLIHLQAGADVSIQGEIQLDWQDAFSSANASVVLETAESGVSGAVISAGDYRVNPFHSVSLFLQYVSAEDVPESPPMRLVCSQPTRIEVYQLDQALVAIDAQGNGSLSNQGDELFAKSDGNGNFILPLSKGRMVLNVLVYPQEGIREEGLTVQIEVFVGGSWQIHSTNRLAK